jgi:hypothetical protein
MNYYFYHDDKVNGPLAEGMLREMVEKGVLPGEVLICPEGSEQWQAYKQDQTTVSTSAPSAESTPKKSQGFMIALLVGLVFFFVIFVIPQIMGPPRGTGSVDSEESNAYYAAREMMQNNYPGVKNIAPYPEAKIQRTATGYNVAVVVDGVNSFNAPIKKVVGISVKRDGDRWIAEQIGQR